jgi:hypothetical protein
MEMISGQLSRLKGLIEVQQEVLESNPADLAPGLRLVESLKAQRTEIIVKQQQCMNYIPEFLLFQTIDHATVTSTSGPIDLEFSVGKWNGSDVRELEEPLLALVIRVGGCDITYLCITDPNLSLVRQLAC